MVYCDDEDFPIKSNYKIKNDLSTNIKGGAVKELKETPEEKEAQEIIKDKNKNMSIIPQKNIKDNKISQEKLNKFVNLKLKF